MKGLKTATGTKKNVVEQDKWQSICLAITNNNQPGGQDCSFHSLHSVQFGTGFKTSLNTSVQNVEINLSNTVNDSSSYSYKQTVMYFHTLPFNMGT